MIFFLQIPPSLDKNLFWRISYDAWFTGLTPVLLFILGYIINEIIKKYNEQKRLKDLEEYFRKLIELLNKPLNKQIKEFLKFSHSLKEKKEQLLILDDVTDFHVEQIREISSKDLYTIFIKNKKGNLDTKTELYGKLRANIDFINEVKNSIKDYFPMFWSKYDKYQQDYKLNIENIGVLFHSMVSENINSFTGPDPFLKEFDKIISNWQSLKKSDFKYKDMYVTRNEFIEPIRDLCRIYFANPRSVIISKYIMQCVYAFNDIEETKKVFRRHYLLIAKKLQNSWFEINGTLKKFDSLKRKQFMLQSIIKIILSVFFTFCLFHMPYGYYEATRFIGMLGFALLAYFSYQQNKKTEVIIYVALALLFQPFIKVALGRTIWNITDVIVSVGLIISIFVKPTNQ